MWVGFFPGKEVGFFLKLSLYLIISDFNIFSFSKKNRKFNDIQMPPRRLLRILSGFWSSQKEEERRERQTRKMYRKKAAYKVEKLNVIDLSFGKNTYLIKNN